MMTSLSWLTLVPLTQGNKFHTALVLKLHFSFLSFEAENFEADSVAESNSVEEWVFPRLVKPSSYASEEKVVCLERESNDGAVPCTDLTSLCAESQYIIAKLLNLNGFRKDSNKKSEADKDEEDEAIFDPLISPLSYLSSVGEGMALNEVRTVLGSDSPMCCTAEHTVTKAMVGEEGVAVSSVESISSVSSGGSAGSPAGGDEPPRAVAAGGKRTRASNKAELMPKVNSK